MRKKGADHFLFSSSSVHSSTHTPVKKKQKVHIFQTFSFFGGREGGSELCVQPVLVVVAVVACFSVLRV